MTETPLITGPVRDRYDQVTIAFHWLTALLVLVLFGTYALWEFAPRGMVPRRLLESLHVSFGIALAAIVLGRLLWRGLAGRRLHTADSSLTTILSRLVHIALYVLLAAEIVLGFGMRWLDGEQFSFFGWFSIPQLFATNRGLAHLFEDLHNLAGWAIIIVATGHAAAALLHRYVMNDDVLQRMLPWTRRLRPRLTTERDDPVISTGMD